MEVIYLDGIQIKTDLADESPEMQQIKLSAGYVALNCSLEKTTKNLKQYKTGWGYVPLFTSSATYGYNYELSIDEVNALFGSDLYGDVSVQHLYDFCVKNNFSLSDIKVYVKRNRYDDDMALALEFKNSKEMYERLYNLEQQHKEKVTTSRVTFAEKQLAELEKEIKEFVDINKIQILGTVKSQIIKQQQELLASQNITANLYYKNKDDTTFLIVALDDAVDEIKLYRCDFEIKVLVPT